ncbi:hypothetical protein [Phenylobacterium soli]|nr:hypothetical protein [Phenylobacterium soli]
MDDSPRPDAGAYILRALHASEIAESCPDPELRQAFQDLTGTWLAMAAGEDRDEQTVQPSA